MYYSEVFFFQENFENSRILNDTNNLDIFCCRMYSCARVDCQSALSAAVAFEIKDRMSDLKKQIWRRLYFIIIHC